MHTPNKFNFQRVNSKYKHPARRLQDGVTQVTTENSAGNCHVRLVYRRYFGNMAGESINDLKKWAAELARRSGEGNEVGLNRAVDLISRNFAVRPMKSRSSRSLPTIVSCNSSPPIVCAKSAKFRPPALIPWQPEPCARNAPRSSIILPSFRILPSSKPFRFPKTNPAKRFRRS